MRLRNGLGLIFIIFAFHSEMSWAVEDFPVNARLFIGQTNVSPDNLNTEMTAQSLKKIDSITQLGVEATLTPYKHFNFGLRYTRRYVKSEENPDNSATDYFGQIDQDSILFLARIPLVNSGFFTADIFGGIGGSNTTFTIKTAGQNGELTRRKDNGWFATPYSAFGGSVAVGFKKLYLVAEGGVESNKVDKFDRSGNVNGNVGEIDLSGSYVTVGIMFMGIPASKK